MSISPLRGQETGSETPTAGTIQGVVKDIDGNPVPHARVSYTSDSTDTKGTTRAGADGTYVSEVLAPGTYLVHADGKDMLASPDISVTVTGTAASQANFTLDWINPGPLHVSSRFPGDVVDTLPINGRNYLNAGRLEPDVQAVDGVLYEPGKTGVQSLSIDGPLGRTTRYDFDEVESMDETKGAATMTLPAEGVREVVISRATPEVFQSLNAVGAVRVTTNSAGQDWHGNLFANVRDSALGMAGFPPGNAGYSREQYGFGAGGAVKDKRTFLFLSGEGTKQDGSLPTQVGYPAPNGISLRDAYFRENMLLGRLDHNLHENMKLFVRVNYDDANQVGPPDSLSSYRNQINVKAAAFGLDWNQGRFVRSLRVGIDKMVNSISPDLGASYVDPLAPFRIQLGSFSMGPSVAGPRQTIQSDLYARYDASTIYKVDHTIRLGAAFHRIAQGDYFAPGSFGPSVTSSNGLATIEAIDGNASLSGGATNPLNYPVGTITIFNGLGNFSEKSAFNRSTGGHTDYRVEGYLGDTFNALPNLNLSFGFNYVLDTARTNSDLGALLCSQINKSIVAEPPCSGNTPLLNQYGFLPPIGGGAYQTLGALVPTPYYNIAPQAGLAWDPGHNGRTVVRLSGGMFYDNFLLQNSYQDRINRLATGQYNRSLKLCPTGAILFPDGSLVSSVDGLDIATEICGQPIGAVAGPIQDLQSEFMARQAAVTSGPNIYSLTNSLGDFGGMISPTYRTPRVVHLNAGLERQVSDRTTFSVDYMLQIGTQFPLEIDSNHTGDALYLTDGDNPNLALNTYAAELAAINATLAANPASAGCPQAIFAGGSSQAAVNCYIANVPGASITDFARHGLDSTGSYCGPWACSVLGKQQASFGGLNPTVGSNLMVFPSGRSNYQALQLAFHTTSAPNLSERVRKVDVSFSYTYSRYRSNIATPTGTGGDYSVLSVAEDFQKPHLGHLGVSGMDRTHQIVVTPTFDLPQGIKLSMIGTLASPLPLTAYIPQVDGGGVAGEIFRSDTSGDGTVGDIVNGSYIGTMGRYSSTKVTKAIAYYNANVAGRLTPAGVDLVNASLLSPAQMLALGAYSPIVQSLPGRWAGPSWLKTLDMRLSWPFTVGERFKVEPNFSVFNVFNLSNYGGAGNQLSGILDAAPGTSLNNATSPGVCGNSTVYCTSRLDRILPGSGTYSNGAPRQLEFGVRLIF